MSLSTISDDHTARQSWMGILARTSAEQLEQQWQDIEIPPDYSFLREPEIGLVMVRARAGGNGQRFNMGEMTVTRCSIALTDGTVGHGYIKGRNQRHAELAALFDAILQKNPDHSDMLTDLTSTLEKKRQTQSVKTAATKVDFYTMVRGED